MTLEVDIFARNMVVTENVRNYVDKKASKLDKYLNSIEEVRVDLASVKTARNANDRNVAQITIRGKGFILRSEERSDDLFAAIDQSLEKIHRQIERYKGKRRRGRGDGMPVGEAFSMPIDADDEIEEPIIARRKEFTLIPMSEAEAIEQMTLLGHEDFFIFYNVESNAINVLYTRRDGTYGLIHPTLG